MIINDSAKLAIIEIGSTNTKTYIYQDNNLIFENCTTIEFKKNYYNNAKIDEDDISKLCNVIKKALEYTENIYICECSIFRNINKQELEEINTILNNEFNLTIEVLSQEDEAMYTAMGAYNNIDYNGNICIFIGGGGSTELIFVSNGVIVDKKYFGFG